MLPTPLGLRQRKHQQPRIGREKKKQNRAAGRGQGRVSACAGHRGHREQLMVWGRAQAGCCWVAAAGGGGVMRASHTAVQKHRQQHGLAVSWEATTQATAGDGLLRSSPLAGPQTASGWWRAPIQVHPPRCLPTFRAPSLRAAARGAQGPYCCRLVIAPPGQEITHT